MTADRHIPDQDLFRQLTAEDELSALDILFERYWKKLYAAAYVRLKDEDDAKDCVQEVFIVLWHKRKRLPLPESVAGYLYQVLKNRVINALHARAVREKHVGRYLEDRSGYQDDSLADIETKELAVIIEDEIARMPEQMRTIYQMSRQENMPGLDIAARLNLSHQTVRNQIASALKRIRARLQQYQIQ